MKQIAVKEIQLRHFRSFTGPTAVGLEAPPGLTFVTGVNEVEPRLGANGVGKSTLFDALCFCLYGVSVKGLRASDLISYGFEDCAVEVVLEIDAVAHRIRRTAPPNRISLNGSACEQNSIDALVGLSRVRFLNSIVFGQAAPLFLDLSIPARGDLLDEVLDLELWMRAAQKSSAEHVEKSKSLVEVRTLLANLTGQLAGLPNLFELRAQEEAWLAERDANIQNLIEEQTAIGREITALVDGFVAGKLTNSSTAKQAYQDAQAQANKIRETRAVAQREIQQLKDDHAFFDENAECPTCGQEISNPESHTARIGERLVTCTVKLTQLQSELSAAQERVIATQGAWQRAERERGAVVREQELHDGRVREKRDLLARLSGLVARLREQPNPFTQQRIATTERQKDLRQQVRVCWITEKDLLAGLTGLEYWRSGFRKLRLFCLEQVLQELSLEAGNQLAALGLPGWRVSFTTANETRSGTLKLGVQADIRQAGTETRLDMLSGGEGQRARLAVSLGLASLIQRHAGVNWTLEVFDEPTAWLSQRGVEDLLESLGDRAAQTRKSIYLCDHRALQHGAFAQTIQLVKDRDGSRVEYLPE